MFISIYILQKAEKIFLRVVKNVAENIFSIIFAFSLLFAPTVGETEANFVEAKHRCEISLVRSESKLQF